MTHGISMAAVGALQPSGCRSATTSLGLRMVAHVREQRVT